MASAARDVGVELGHLNSSRAPKILELDLFKGEEECARLERIDPLVESSSPRVGLLRVSPLNSNTTCKRKTYLTIVHHQGRLDPYCCAQSDR